MTKPILSFSVLSDLHFMAYQDPERPVDWVPFLEGEIAYIASLEPDFLVINGDLTNGKERDYRLAQAALAPCSMPVYHTMGNHEYYGYYEDDPFSPELAQQRFMQMTRSPSIYYEQQQEGYSFLFLSTENYKPDTNDTGWLSEKQLSWFEERLTAVSDAPVFVFLHHPINDTVADSDNTCVQSDELRAILKRHPCALVFTGHTHCRMDREDQIIRRDGTVYIGGGCMYEEFPQSRWVDLYADRAVIRLLCHRERKWLETFETSIYFK